MRATQINEAMKLAATKAIAKLAHEPVPEVVNMAYNEKNLSFGKNYIIPKPNDPRLITVAAPAVAQAAMESGVARIQITDWTAYHEQLLTRLGLDNKFMNYITAKAKQQPKRVVFAEADNFKILKAAQIVKEEGVAIPVLLGNEDRINSLIRENNLELSNIQIIDPLKNEEKAACLR